MVCRELVLQTTFVTRYVPTVSVVFLAVLSPLALRRALGIVLDTVVCIHTTQTSSRVQCARHVRGVPGGLACSRKLLGLSWPAESS